MESNSNQNVGSKLKNVEFRNKKSVIQNFAKSWHRVASTQDCAILACERIAWTN